MMKDNGATSNNLINTLIVGASVIVVKDLEAFWISSKPRCFGEDGVATFHVVCVGGHAFYPAKGRLPYIILLII